MGFKKTFYTTVVYLIFLFSFLEWGFFAHKKINRYSVYTLERNKNAQKLFNFYYENMDYLIDHAGDPDKRRFTKGESQKHFINLETFGSKMMKQDYVSYSEFENVYAYQVAEQKAPKHQKREDIEKMVKNIIKKGGTNPWAIAFTKDALTKAFREKNKDRILSETVNLMHYIGDSCVVFHCTNNYEGQLTGQKGIHALWESTIPEYFFEEFGINENSVPVAEYDGDYKKTAWKNCLLSNKGAKRALKIEKKLNEAVILGKFSYTARGKNVYRMNSKEYAREYNRRLNGQIKEQMLRAIKLIGDFIYTAWVDAGRPYLGTNGTYTRTKKNNNVKSDKEDSDPFSTLVAAGVVVVVVIAVVILEKIWPNKKNK